MELGRTAESQKKKSLANFQEKNYDKFKEFKVGITLKIHEGKRKKNKKESCQELQETSADEFRNRFWIDQQPNF